MKNMLLIITLLLLFAPIVFGGELQQQYDKKYSKKYNIFKKNNAIHLVQQDLKKYQEYKSIYGELLHLICDADLTNSLYLEKIRENFDNCNENLKCWGKIEINNSDNKLLDESTKRIIEFNNLIYSKYKNFENTNATLIVKKDLKKYQKSKSIYSKLIYLISNSDETNYRYLKTVRKNFDNCSEDLKCWEYIEIDNYYYGWLNEPSKHVIWFNNMVYLNR